MNPDTCPGFSVIAHKKRRAFLPTFFCAAAIYPEMLMISDDLPPEYPYSLVSFSSSSMRMFISSRARFMDSASFLSISSSPVLSML